MTASTQVQSQYVPVVVRTKINKRSVSCLFQLHIESIRYFYPHLRPLPTTHDIQLHFHRTGKVVLQNIIVAVDLIELVNSRDVQIIQTLYIQQIMRSRISCNNNKKNNIFIAPTVPDPVLEIRRPRSSRPLDEGGGWSTKNFFLGPSGVGLV